MLKEGFIKNNLDTKFLILYVCSHVIEPISLDSVLEICMCDSGVNYFLFTDCLEDLVNTGHLKYKSDEHVYQITRKGLTNAEICSSSLPSSVRKKADKHIFEFNQRMKRKKLVRVKKVPRENGSYTLSLILDDEVDNVMHLNLMVSNEEMCNTIAKKFESDAESIYSGVIKLLTEKKKGKE